MTTFSKIIWGAAQRPATKWGWKLGFGGCYETKLASKLLAEISNALSGKRMSEWRVLVAKKKPDWASLNKNKEKNNYKIQILTLSKKVGWTRMPLNFAPASRSCRVAFRGFLHMRRTLRCAANVLPMLRARTPHLSSFAAAQNTEHKNFPFLALSRPFHYVRKAGQI